MHVQLSTGLKHQHMQNSRQLWGGWVGPTLYAISIQKKTIDNYGRSLIHDIISLIYREPAQKSA